MSNKILLSNVRLSFPSLFQRATFNGEETKFEATFLLNKDDHKDLIKKIDAGIREKIKVDLKGAKVGADKLCMKDGDEAGYDGYEDCMSVKASNKNRPLVVDRAKNPLTEEDGVVYSGCYVNATIELWAQNNAYGKRINANLLAIQFVKDGESFGVGGTKGSVDDFDVIDDDMEDFM